MKITIKVEVASGNKAYRVGEAYSYEGVDWRNGVDSCYDNGNGVVFLDCEDEETAEFVFGELYKDEERVADFECQETESKKFWVPKNFFENVQ